MNNAIFVGKDNTGIPRSAFQRGCLSSSTFKMEIAGSDKTVPFAVYGKEDATKLLVFEGAIDAISHASIIKNLGGEWDNCHRISQGGNAPIEAITHFLDDHPSVKSVSLCFDNDKPGQAITEKTCQKLIDSGFHGDIKQIPPCIGKDWNESLTQWKKTLRQAERIPTSETVGDVSGTLVGRIHTINPDTHHIKNTTAYYDNFIFDTLVQAYSSNGGAVVIETPSQLQALYPKQSSAPTPSTHNHSTEPELE